MVPARAEPSSPQPGDVVAGKYRLIRPIGLGAMGMVFEAVHLRMQQRVAIKFMQAKLVSQADAVARFEREGRAASTLTSPHATRIFDVDTTPDGLPYIVSELLEGRDLRHELDERGKLPVEEAVGYVIEACAVMAEAHSFGIVHRDLKPSNLFLAGTSTGRTVKVLDFGISKMEEELELTTTGILLGSPRYMSPEQVEAKRVDRRADLWALGVILFRSISGTYPFEGTTSISLAVAILTQRPRDLASLVPGIPRGLVAAIEKALAPDVAARHTTARDFAEALAPFATPEAAVLARSLTLDLPPPESSKATLVLPTPGADTVQIGKADVDALIEVSLEPLEMATRGTFAQPSTPARPVRSDRRSRWPVRFAGLALVAGLVSAAVFLFARQESPSNEQAGGSTQRQTAARGTAAPPTPSAPQSSPPIASSSAPESEPSAALPTPSSRPAKPASARPAGGPRTGMVPQSAPTPPKNPTYL
jgi:serine/threonine protein kinase